MGCTTQDKIALTFGKYKGKTPNEIAETDPSYIIWMYDTLEPTCCSRYLYRYCTEQRAGSYEEEKDMDIDFGIDGWGQ